MGETPIVIHPDAALTLNYLDTQRLPLTQLHLATAVALLARMVGQPDNAQELALRSLAPEGDAAGALSPREFEVLRMLVDGKPVGEIARSLGLTAKTVANHQSALRQKLGAGTAVQLLHAAARMGLVPRTPAP